MYMKKKLESACGLYYNDMELLWKAKKTKPQGMCNT